MIAFTKNTTATPRIIGKGKFDEDMITVNSSTSTATKGVSFAAVTDMHIIPRFDDIDPTINKADLFYSSRDIQMFRYDEHLHKKYSACFANRNKNKLDHQVVPGSDDDEENEDLSSIMARRYLRHRTTRSKRIKRRQRMLATTTASLF